MTIQINKKECKEILMQRMVLAIITNIAVQFFFVSCLILITNLKTDIVSWIYDTWQTIVSFRMWMYFIMFASVTFLQGIAYSKTYMTKPQYVKNRFLRLQQIFGVQNVLLCALYSMAGAMLVWLHLSLKEGSHNFLLKNCATLYGLCLSEENYFLLLGGFWNGLYFFLKRCTCNIKYFKFSVIPQTKFLLFKKGIYSMLTWIMTTSLWCTIYFMIGYYFLGFYLRNGILSVTSTQIEVKPLDTVHRLLNISLIMYLWLYQLIFMLISNSLFLLFEIYLTEWIPLTIQQNNVFDTRSNALTLTEALSVEQVPIIQHLGYLDLVTLAQKDHNRRSMLFTLSQPGGHPYNWNCIIEKSLEFITKFSNDLNLAFKCKDYQSLATSANLQTSSFAKFHNEHTYYMRNLVAQSIPSSMDVDCRCIQPTENELFIHTFIKNKWQAFVTYLLSKPLIFYFFGEQEDVKVQHVLFMGQSIIWATEAISTLSELSLKEDSYGIVQRDIPAIIEALLTLKHNLDRLQKSGILIRKQQSNDKFVKQIFISLRNASKRSLYRITTSFESYISDLALTPLIIEQLQNFLNYKE